MRLASRSVVSIAAREREREEFLGVAAHELKTPITSIQGYSSLLITHPERTEFAPRALEIIHKQSVRLNHLIEDLFLAMRARAGELRFQPKPLDFTGLVQRILMEVRPYVSSEAFSTQLQPNVRILGDEALPVGEIIPENEIFDYECKYQPGMAAEIFPADIPETLARRLQDLALRVHKALRLDDFSRVDFIVGEDGGVWCLEANNLPGMTANSLLPKAARAAGISFPELCDRIAKLALERRARRSPRGVAAAAAMHRRRRASLRRHPPAGTRSSAWSYPGSGLSAR